MNDRGDAIEALEAKMGIDSSAVTSSHDYKLRNLPGQDGNWDAGSVEVRAQTFQSDQTTGTAPFTVASTTVVSNLNADTVDGLQGTSIVQTSGDQSVGGIKTFTSIPVLPGSNPTTDNQASRKAYVDTKMALSGDEAVAGIKTFSSFPVTPSSAPTTDYQAANKKYVDDNTPSVAAAAVSAISFSGTISSASPTTIGTATVNSTDGSLIFSFYLTPTDATLSPRLTITDGSGSTNPTVVWTAYNFTGDTLNGGSGVASGLTIGSNVSANEEARYEIVMRTTGTSGTYTIGIRSQGSSPNTTIKGYAQYTI